MPTVGSVADFPDRGLARKKAAELALSMVETGKNPNKMKREAGALECSCKATLGPNFRVPLPLLRRGNGTVISGPREW